jgi:PEP-CTERM motif
MKKSFTTLFASALLLCALPAWAQFHNTDVYLLRAATFADGSRLEGSWSIDWNTLTVVSMNLNSSSVGSFTSATVRRLSQSDGGSTGPSDLYEILSEVGGHQLYLDFSARTGALWGVGAAQQTDNYTSLYFHDARVLLSNAGRSDHLISLSPISPVPEPQSYALMLAGMGLLLAVSARRLSRASQLFI